MNGKLNILFISEYDGITSSVLQKLKIYEYNVKSILIEDDLNVKSILLEPSWDIILTDYQGWIYYGSDILRIIKRNSLKKSYIIIGKQIEEKEMVSLIERGISDYIKEDNLQRLIPTIKREIKSISIMNGLNKFHFSQCLLEDEFQRLLKVSNFLIYKLDLHANFLEVNQVFNDLLKYNELEILDSFNVYELLHPEDEPIFTENIKKASEGEYIKDAEYRFKKKNGDYVLLSSILAPIFNEQNHIVGILCVSKDMTEYINTQHFIEDRIHRQEMLAKFGLEAIAEKNIDTLFNKATSLLSEILNVEYTKVLELLPNHKYLKLRAGVGWNDGLVGNATVENNKNSQAGYTLLKTTPVIVENLNKETRFFAPKLLADHDVVSGMSVIIPGKDTPFGILGAHTSKHRKFSKDDINFLQSIANILADIIIRLSTEEELRRSEEKYRTLTEQSLLGTIIIANGEIIFANEGVSKILGFSIDELLTWDINTIGQHIHPQDLKKAIEEYEMILNGDIPSLQTEIRMEKKQNDYLHTRQYIKKIQFQGESALHINIIDISEQKKNEKLLEASLEEKEILLKEIHHRVKNNLQIISSLIVLQEEHIDDEDIISIFRDFQSRIKAMALIHQILYNSEDFSKIDLPKYIKDLINNLFKAYSARSKRIDLRLNIEDIDLSLDQAISCGLIINELVSNSLKHAFSREDQGKIGVSLKKRENNMLFLEVYDNGRGFPKNLDYQQSSTLGLKLINTITRQMDGKITFEKVDGARVIITWEIKK
ncbi:MAG: hypothetical protein BAJALOKI2v1_110012 [Promethearchaeota archaeon]|nr:MAG: hypothetical protein BAJALOKI2v1_110012 [Candidatus Lokiarchaeota archaeon]